MKKYRERMDRNSEGYHDPTPHYSLKKEQLDEERFKRLMATIFYICENAGFHIEERIVIRDVRTGKVYR